jgi:hypothetical protein
MRSTAIGQSGRSGVGADRVPDPLEGRSDAVWSLIACAGRVFIAGDAAH